MIESPVLQELNAEWTHEGAVEAVRRSIVKFLEARLDDALKFAAKCRSLASFRKRLAH